MYTESFVEDFTDKKIALENVYSVIKTAIECNRIFWLLYLLLECPKYNSSTNYLLETRKGYLLNRIL